ncbi:MAG: hypothetical protein IPO06_05675 [Leptospiraceae bacterium]|nr:hypothetical protein [Leptospiraceae bacterium]
MLIPEPRSIVTVLFPSWRVSSTPVRFTICGVFQLASVNFKLIGFAVISELLEELIFISTSLVGVLFSFTENEELVPDSLVIIPVLELIVKPAGLEFELSEFVAGEGFEFPGGGKRTCCALSVFGKSPSIALGQAIQFDIEKE